MSRKATPLPRAIIPFLLENMDGFDVVLEDDERIVITPKEGATINPASRRQLANALLAKDRTRPASNCPRFIYRVSDPKCTPEMAKRSGMTPPRHAVYTAIYNAESGIDHKAIREKTKLTHGAVAQILHWLRKQNLIIAKNEPLV
jgi:hypothetical protein